MRKLLLLCLVACNDDDADIVCGDGVAESFEQCDDGNFIGGDGCDPDCQPEQQARVTWAFYPSVDGPEQVGCRPGVSEVEIVTSTAETINRFPCDGPRTANVFVRGQARVLTRLRDANNDIVAESIPQIALGSPIKAPFYEDAGYLLVLAKSCVQWINIVATPAVGNPITQRLDCFNVPVELLFSRPLRAGTYQLQLSGDIVDTRTVEIGANNGITELNFLDR